MLLPFVPQPLTHNRFLLCDKQKSPKMADIEKMMGSDYAQLTNLDIRSFCWKNITATVKDRQTQQPKDLLSDVCGLVKAGELLALMGPS